VRGEGFTDGEVGFYTQHIEERHPTWRVDQRYLIDGWALVVYDEFRMLGEYHTGHIATLRRLAGLPDEARA
jgi:hypothetical protein